MKQKQINLLEGSIAGSLTQLSLPIMATSFIATAYSLVDMFWISRLGAYAVAAVGTGGLFIWFSESFAIIARSGGQVLTGHALGQKNASLANQYSVISLSAAFALSLINALIMFFFAPIIIGFFKFQQTQTVVAGIDYLSTISFEMPFFYLTLTLTGLFTAKGNSRTPFIANTFGLVLNILLDPLFIFVFNMGVKGAAWATVLSHICVFSLMAFAAKKDPLFWIHKNSFSELSKHLSHIFKIGTPVGVQSMLYSGVSIFIGRLVASFGDISVAVQRVGSQVEAISWLTADGIASATNAFIAQNFGAAQYRRAKKGYYSGLTIVIIIGVIASFILYFFAKDLAQLFLKEQEGLVGGIAYLRIISLSQVFMCMEILIAGAFAGYGKTLFPSLIIAVVTLVRLPLGVFLSAGYGVEGVWWAIALTSMLKGILLSIAFYIFVNRWSQIN